MKEEKQPARLPMIPVPWGEVIDKICILEIKLKKIDDEFRKDNVAKELACLKIVVHENFIFSEKTRELMKNLRVVNEILWNIEDEIRKFESIKNFGAEFIVLARSVYIYNDRRSSLKREINIEAKSALVEEKIYS